MDIRFKIMELEKSRLDLEDSGYTRGEAIQMLQAAALCSLADCINEGYDCKKYLKIHGSIASYEQ